MFQNRENLAEIRLAERCLRYPARQGDRNGSQRSNQAMQPRPLID
jgi:hypothetical protein